MLQRTIRECGAVDQIERIIADNVARATAVLADAPFSRDGAGGARRARRRRSPARSS